MRAPCVVEGCEKPNYGHGMCNMHYSRLRRWGSLEDPRPPGRYVKVKDPDHPLAAPTGWLLEHRQVLYNKVGPDDQACHWCTKTIRWVAERRGDRIYADHLDEDTHNNDRSNLVPSCLSCNANRSRMLVTPNGVDPESPALKDVRP